MNNKTVVIQIGNSDNKLSQTEWATFVHTMRHEAILKNCVQIHFAGGPGTHERWQNFAFIVECKEEQVAPLRAAVKDIRDLFEQDSAAFMVGDTEFV